MSKEVIVDETPAPVDDHPFYPRNGLYWGLCNTCGLAAAAHKSSTVSLAPSAKVYRCPECVEIFEPICNHDPDPLPVPEVHVSEAEEWTAPNAEVIEFSGKMCTICGGMLIQSGNCETCSSCGASTGCG